MGAAAVVHALAHVREATEKAQAELGALDALAGDGDHGVTMVLGWRAVEAALAREPLHSPGGVLMAAAEAFADVGGTAGPLWGTALLRAGRALAKQPTTGTGELARAAEAAAIGIRERGRCAAGDRTLLDAMAPAAAALKVAAAEGCDLTDAMRSAAEAAVVGARATASLTPKRGRAARAPDRVRGQPDAGARACAIFWAAIASACSDGESSLTKRMR